MTEVSPVPRYHCDACNADLTDEIRIKCADCADFDLCLQCFGDGVEPSGFTHKNSHRYRVMEVLDFPIFAKDWAADEELLLVEAAEKLGLGNWDAIAEHIGTKTRDECEQHYNSVYLKSPLWPLPIESPQFDLLEARRQLRELAAERAAQPFRKPIIKHSKPLASAPTNHEVAGFMPGRGEFDQEPENEADHLVKDMTFHDPIDQDEAFKLVVAEIYNDRLNARAEKKAVAFERGLIDFRRWNNQEKKRGKEEKDAMAKLRVFSRVMSKEDYTLLDQAVTAEIQTRARIAQLQEWRKMGITTLHQGIVYEREKQHRLSQRLMGTATTIQVPMLNSLTSAAANMTWNTTTKHRAVPKTDVASLPDAHLLTNAEQTLCAYLHIEPREYLYIKNMLVTECLKANGLTRAHAHTMLGEEVDGKGKAGALFDFFEKAAWVWLPVNE